MNVFVDPRTDPTPGAKPPTPRLTDDRDEVEELRQLCRDGRLYEVERWIQAGRPLQLPEGRPPGRSRWQSPLEIALEAERAPPGNPTRSALRHYDGACLLQGSRNADITGCEAAVDTGLTQPGA